MGHILYLVFGMLLGLKSNYRSRSKDGGGGGFLRRLNIVLHDNCFKGRHYSFLRQFRIDPLAGNTAPTGDGEHFSTGKEDSSEFGGSVSPASSGSSHTSPFQL